MALPAEPRQKMINIMYLVLTALLALNVSAEILKAFKVVDGSLRRSNENLSASTADIYASFENAKKDPKTAANAAKFQPMAEEVRKETEIVLKVVEEYRKKITDEAEPEKKEDGTMGVKREDNLDIGSRIMESKGGGEVVFAAIENYRNKLKAILGPEDYKNAFGAAPAIDDKAIKNGKDLAKQNFYMQPVVANLTMLSKTINDIKNTEGDAARYIFSKVGGVVIKYNKFKALVGTNSTYLMPNEEMIVTAGLGAFSDAPEAATTISINGQSAPIGADGVAERKFPVTSSGSVNVVINYKDPNTGLPAPPITKTIQYIVGTPGGASVSADKMNVLYIGVDNPVTVASGKGWDKTTVSMQGGSLSGTQGHYMARVTSPGMANIIVNMEGKGPVPFPFRVKYLPPAAAGIGANLQQDGNMPAATFRAMGGIRAALVGSEFDATYNVISYTIVGAGAGFSPSAFATNSGGFWSGSAKAVADKAVPGSIMSFTNIVVKGPDGREVKAANSTVVIRCQ
jgi:gliding motility-associated protein GldM